MADEKITELDAVTQVVDTDILPVVVDPGGAPITKKITVAEFREHLYVKLTGSQTTTVTTNVDITGLSFAVVSGAYYRFRFNILYRAAATTTGIRLSVTIPAATVFAAAAQCETSTVGDGTGSEHQGRITTSGDQVVGTGTPATGADFMVGIEGIIVPSANGTLQAVYASEVSGSGVTVAQGSMGIMDTVP